MRAVLRITQSSPFFICDSVFARAPGIGANDRTWGEPTIRDEFSKINSRSESPPRLRGGRSLSSGWGLGNSFDVHLHVFADPVLAAWKTHCETERVNAPLCDLDSIPSCNVIGVKNQNAELNRIIKTFVHSAFP